jgi:phospholipase C
VGSLAACLLLAACNGSAVSPTPPAAGNAADASGALAPSEQSRLFPSANPIAHVVIIMQENRSVDNLFHGYPGAATSNSGKNHLGQTIALTAASLAANFDILHRFTQAVQSIDYPKGEAMDGFDLSQCKGAGCSSNAAYTYVQQSDVQTYWNMAQQYVLADHFFASDLDSSFQGHQYLIAGQAEQTWGIPTNLSIWGCDGGTNDTVQLLKTTTKPGTTTKKKIRTCFDPPVTQSIDNTLGDELDAKGLQWTYYAPAAPGKPGSDPGYIWSAYDAINHIRNGPDWTAHVVSPPKAFLTDVGSGKLAPVTWIAPDLVNSDHPGNLSKNGPAWVASLVNAVGNSQFWNSTAIFILWDDWGGLYDSIPPPLLDYDGLGIRVPLIVISPYALQNNVAKTTYEFGSVLKFTETLFGLSALAASDTRANTFGSDVFNFSQPPRPFSPFAEPRGSSFFMQQAPSQMPPDGD